MDTPITSMKPSPSTPETNGGALVVLALALVIAVTGAVVTFVVSRDVTRQVTTVEEEQRPAKLQIVKVTAADCPDCFSLDTALQSLRGQRVEITEEREVTSTSDEGKKLIADHGITRIPAYLAFGEVQRGSLPQYFEGQGMMHGDMFVFTKTPPVFIDAATGTVHGRITVTLLANPAQCPGCYDPLQLIDQLKAAGVVVTTENVVSPQSAEGRSLITRYAITKLPTFILQPSIEDYDLFQGTGLGTVEKDGTFVLRDLPAPYLDTKKGRIVGNVELIMLTDKSCAECYSVDAHKNILSSFGMRFARERTVDSASSEGKQLIRAYSITSVPTILLSPDASAYTQLGAVWKSVGTIEKNGWYIFRHPELMGDAVYKDLTKNEIIRPKVK